MCIRASFYGERVIRKLLSHVADHPAVIGYQVDNETKYYDSVSEAVSYTHLDVYKRQIAHRVKHMSGETGHVTLDDGSEREWFEEAK